MDDGGDFVPVAPRLAFAQWHWPLAFAAWCLFWPWLPLIAAHTLPGMLTLEPMRGLYEVPEIFLGLPLWQLSVLLFGTACLFLYGALALGRMLDPRGSAAEALRWTLGSSSLNLLMIALILLPPFLHRRSDAAEAYVSIAMFAALVLLPFWGWNPDSLRRDMPVRWWRPYWPGVKALFAVATFVWLTAHGYTALQDGSSGWPWWSRFLLDSAGFLVTGMLQTVAIVIWLQRGYWPEVRAALSRQVKPSFVGAWMQAQLLLVVCAFALLLPFAVGLGVMTHVQPQYETWELDRQLVLTPGIRALFAVSEGASVAVMQLILGMAMYYLRWQARLLIVSRIVYPDAETGRAQNAAVAGRIPIGF